MPSLTYNNLTDAKKQQILQIAFKEFTLHTYEKASVSNIIKPIVVLRAAESLAPLGAFYHPADKLLSQGHSGENWEINDTHSQPQRADLIETRLRGALYLPLREIAAEQIAAAAEIDQAATAAFRFPDGLYAQMGKIGEVEVTRLINEVTATRTRAA